MDVHAAVEAPCDAPRLFSLVDDLALYPSWIDLVHDATADAAEPDGPAWRVELRARVGPLARSKRLRMVRTEHRPADGVVVFERRELDGRQHSPWILRATVTSSPAGSGSTVAMHLHYGGALWTGGVLERVLADQISSGSERLAALASA
ncbi:MAG: SRPBCC family protein [Ilumatobacteraceae bacterium]